MKNRLLSVAVIIATFNLGIVIGVAQNAAKPVAVAIKVDNVSIDPHHQVKVRVRISNHSGHSFKKNVFALEFHLEKNVKRFSHCTRGECFSTAPFWLKKFENGQTYEITADLTKFYWNDQLSSAYSPNHPKNMSAVILPDDYSLFLSFWVDFPASNEQPAFRLEGKSDPVEVKVERRR